MRRYMADVVAAYPKIAQDMTIGWTHQRRPIVTIKVWLALSGLVYDQQTLSKLGLTKLVDG